MSSTFLFALIIILVIIAAAVLPELIEGVSLQRVVWRLLFFSALAIVVAAGYFVLFDMPTEASEPPTPVVTANVGGGGQPTAIVLPVEETAVSSTEVPIPPTETPQPALPTSTLPSPTLTSPPTSAPITPIVLTSTPIPPEPPLPPTVPPVSLPIIRGVVPTWYQANVLFPPFAVPTGVGTGGADYVSNESVNWNRINPDNTMGRLYSYQRFYSNADLCAAENGLYGYYSQIIFFESSGGAAQFYNWALSSAVPNRFVGEQAYTAVSTQSTNGCTLRRYTVAFQRANVFYKVRVLVHEDAAHLTDYAWEFAWNEAYRMDAHLSSLIQ